MPSLSRAVAAFMTSSFVGTATQVAKGKLTAEYLGAEGVGIYNQISLCFTLVLTICVLGFPNGITRAISVEHDAGNDDQFVAHLSSPLIFLGLLSLVVSGAAVFFAEQISHFLFVDNGERAGLTALALAAVPLAVIGYVYRALLNGTRSVQALVRARITADLASVVVFAGLLIPFGIVGAVLGFVSLQAIYLGLIAFGAWRNLGRLSLPRVSAFRWSVLRQNVGYGFHGLIYAAAGGFVTLILSRWVIAQSGLADSGLLNVSLKIATVYLAGIYAAASGYFYASIARARDDTAVGNEIENAIMVYMSLIPPLVAVLMAGGEVILQVLFSEEFIAAAVLLLIILPADIFRLLSEIIGQALVAKRKLAVQISLYLSWLAIYVGVSYLVIEDYGIVGVAIGYLVGQACLCVFMLIAGKRLLSFSMSGRSWRFVARGIALAFGCAIVTYSIDSTILRILAGAISISLWFGASMLEPDFRNQLDKAFLIIKARLKLE